MSSTLSTISNLLTDLSGLSSISVMTSTIVQDLSGNLTLMSTLLGNIIDITTPTGIIDAVNSLQLPLPSVQPILSLDDLVNSYELEIEKEAIDRATIASFMNPSYDGLKEMLKPWAKMGFPPGYSMSSISLVVPPVCADGVNRSLTFYFEYLLGVPISTALQTLASNTTGMSFTYSHDGYSTITLHISKT